jgi:hypothetical protein
MKILLRSVPFREASLHRSNGPRDLRTLSSALLAEDGEQDDSPPTRDVVRDTHRLADGPEVEPTPLSANRSM